MKITFYLLFLVFLAASCIEGTDTEMEQPTIELLSPVPCETLMFGDAFNYRVKITDNTGLGKISMDLHHNFGHHNHGAHKSCGLDATKDAINPYSDNWIFSLPTEKKEHVFDTLLTLAARKNDSTLFDPGDYHFHIYVSDNDGYQVFTTLDLKILN